MQNYIRVAKILKGLKILLRHPFLSFLPCKNIFVDDYDEI